jgi:acyl-CoA synthetase (AMP-forming)/AMP-acid ligase II
MTQAESTSTAELLPLDGLPDTLPHVLVRTATARPDHPALVDVRRTLTYGEVREQMMALAAALVRAGLQKGDRVGIWLPNCAEWVVACMGVQAAGGTIIPLNTRYKAGEVGYALNKSHARFLIHADRFAGNDYGAMLDTIEAKELIRSVPVAMEGADDGPFSAFLAEGRADAEAMTEAQRRFDGLTGDDVSDIMFTSGTTGAPKGVVTTHGQNVRTYVEWVKATTINADDRFLLIWPFCHCSGYKSGWLVSMMVGCTVYPEATLDIDRLIARSIKEQITFLPGPPNLFQTMLNAGKEAHRSLSSLRVVGTGGTTIDPALIKAIRSELGAQVIYAGYGLTECCGTAAMIYSGDPPEKVIESTGRPIGGTELVAMDRATGAILPRGEEGELVTRGYHVMQGYLDDPAATAETIDADGWMHTGDLGMIDKDGFVCVTGRAKDMYISGGFNCYPAEIENMLHEHPGVREAAVIGLADERLGEVGCAFIVWDPGQGEPSEEALIAWCKGQMANYKVPRSIVFTDALPRNAMGKVEKYRLSRPSAN